MTAWRNKNCFPRKEFLLNFLYYSQALETHQQQHCSQEPNNFYNHLSCRLCIGLCARKISVLDPLGVNHHCEKNFRYFMYFYNYIYLLISLSKSTDGSNYLLQCINRLNGIQGTNLI